MGKRIPLIFVVLFFVTLAYPVSSKTTKGSGYLRQAFVKTAVTAKHPKDGYLSAQDRGLVKMS